MLEERVPDMARVETLQTGRAIREMNAQISRLPEWLLVFLMSILDLRSLVSDTVVTLQLCCEPIRGAFHRLRENY